MKYLLLFLILSFCLPFSAGSQVAYFPVKSYTTRDYGESFNPENLAVAQASSGIIYAANGHKLIEFDGTSWRSYPISRLSPVLSLAAGKNDRIYAGAQNEFGYFEPDGRGELKYISLSDSLPPSDHDFMNVWKTHIAGDAVLFQSEEKIFVFRNDSLRIINPVTSFHTSFTIGERVFIRQREAGLMELKDDKLTPLAGGEIFDTTGIFLMAPFDEKGEEILVGTREKGFWIYNGSPGRSGFRRFSIENSEALESAVITDGLLTGSGEIAVGTMFGGIFFIDRTGRIIQTIDKRHGLSDNTVRQLISDLSGNIWAVTNNGINRIEVTSPVSWFKESSGITGSINAILRFNNRLYIGTGNGLIIQHENMDQGFSRRGTIDEPVRSLINAGGILVAGTDAGIYTIEPTPLRIDTVPSFVLFYDREKRVLFSGGKSGLRAYSRDAGFRKLERFLIPGEDIISIEIERNIKDATTTVWLGKRQSGIIRLKVKEELSFESESYSINDGLPDGPVVPALIDTIMVFGTSDGFYSFQDSGYDINNLPDSLKDNKELLKGFFSPFTPGKTKGIREVSVIVATESKVWLCALNKAGFLDRKGNLEFVTRPFEGINAGKIYTIYPENENITWIGTSDGLIRFNGTTVKDYEHEYSTAIRKALLIDSDSAIFMGSGSGNEPAIPFKSNSVRFEFSAPYFEYQENIFYSYKLEGLSSEWSQWQKETYQEFINLREGQYVFRVRARNVYGTLSREQSYSFTIMPPWYRSVIAYITYAILAAILTWLIARLYSYRLKKENLRLEGIITERTAEIVRQKDEILNKNFILVQQKKEIEDSIRYAMRIQTAVIPSENACREILAESFIFFRPLNIVSGDFYWISRIEGRIIFAVADCTGHGVPGAFMSMLGVAFLNEIVNNNRIVLPAEILNNLRNKVISALQQQGLSGEARDGMDIALISIDLSSGLLSYSGAYNPLILIRNGAITEIAADKMPVGFFEKMRPFSNHETSLVKGDRIYMCSDGYEDQFGGPEGKKMKSKRMKAFLLEISNLPASEQRDMVEKFFDDWKGDHPQVDDVVVAGIVIK